MKQIGIILLSILSLLLVNNMIKQATATTEQKLTNELDKTNTKLTTLQQIKVFFEPASQAKSTSNDNYKEFSNEIVSRKATDTEIKEYINRFRNVAIEEEKKYGIPASITLGQGLLESNAGKSSLAQRDKNHFGIKCFARDCKKGHCSNHGDDTHKDFFRTYKTDWESFRAHSLFLQRSRYQHLKKIPRSDYKKWSHGLQKAGYATDKKYSEKLITVIETHNLHKLK